MIRRTQLLALGITALASLACAPRGTPSASPHSLASYQPGAATAFVKADTAQFIFPVNAPARFLPTLADTADGYPNQGFLWSVSWDPGWERLGTVPHGLVVNSDLPPVLGPGQDTLRAIVARSRASHLVFDIRSPGTPASEFLPEPALGVAVLRNQVVLSVRGLEAHRRLRPEGLPDTVTFYWRGPGGQHEQRRLAVVRIR